jgi:hypothetical protein
MPVRLVLPGGDPSTEESASAITAAIRGRPVEAIKALDLPSSAPRMVRLLGRISNFYQYVICGPSGLQRALVRCRIWYDAREFRNCKMSGPPIEEILIVGITTGGETFRPSDWAERLCGCMSLFGEDQRISYSPYLKPIIASGVKCVVVDRRLEQMSPEAFKFLMSFCGDNELQVREGRHEIRQSLQVRNDIRVA